MEKRIDQRSEIIHVSINKREEYLKYANVLTNQLLKLTADPNVNTDKEFEEFSKVLWTIIKALKGLYFYDKNITLN